MAVKFPRTLRLLSGKGVKIQKVWYEMGRGVYRVSYFPDGEDSTPKGTLATVEGLEGQERFEVYIPPARDVQPARVGGTEA